MNAYIIVSGAGNETKFEVVKATPEVTLEKVIADNPGKAVLDVNVVGKSIAETLVANSENIKLAQQLFNSLDKEFLAEIGLKHVQFDSNQAWFSLLLVDGTTTISVAIKDGGVRFRKRNNGELVKEQTGVSLNAANAALKAFIE